MNLNLKYGLSIFSCPEGITIFACKMLEYPLLTGSIVMLRWIGRADLPLSCAVKFMFSFVSLKTIP